MKFVNVPAMEFGYLGGETLLLFQQHMACVVFRSPSLSEGSSLVEEGTIN